MKITPKSLVQITISCTAFFFTAQLSFAQFVSMPTKISTPHGNITVNQQVYMPGMYGYGYRIPNKKHRFTIVLLNDSTMEGKGRIKIDNNVHALNCKINASKITILPSETKEIFHTDAEGRKMTGKPMDSCWAFLVGTGKIRTYSVTAEPDNPIIAYIQKGDFSSIVALTRENLEPLVSDNEKALELAKKGRLLRAVRVYNKDTDPEE